MFPSPVRPAIRFAALLALSATLATAQNFPNGSLNPRIVLTNVPNTGFGVMGLDFLSDGRMVLLSNGSVSLSAEADLGGGDIQEPSAQRDFAVYLVSGLSATGDLSNVTATKILDQLTGPPPGVVVVNDTVYVMDRTAFYRINSLNPTGGISKAQNATRLIDVPGLDSDFVWNRGPSGHQWMFTPQYHDGRFYAAYSGSIRRPATSGAPPTNTVTGAILSWARDTVVEPNLPVASPNNNRGYRREAGGLRSPNGMATNGRYMLHTDNQGSFNPGNAVRIYTPGQPLMTYGHRQATLANRGSASLSDLNPTQSSSQAAANTVRNWAEDLPYMPPVIWIPFEPFRSISQPVYMHDGPYKGQWLLGDVNGVGVGRLLLDDVDSSGRYQASFTLFSGGALNSFGITGSGMQLYRAINRMTTSPDGAIYIGSIYRRNGNWTAGPTAPVLRMTFRDTSLFEILTVRSRKSADGTANGVEVFFSEPLDPATVSTSSFTLTQYNYSFSARYGCSATECQTKTPQVTGVTLSDDRRKAFIAIATPDTSIGAAHFGTWGQGNNTTGVWTGPGKQDRTLRVTVNSAVRSASGSSLFYNIAWLGWHFQANTRFNPASTDTYPPLALDRPKTPAQALAGALTIRKLPGAVEIRVDRTGPVTVTLHAVDGTLRRTLSSPNGILRIDTRDLARGIHVLRVRQADAVHARALML